MAPRSVRFFGEVPTQDMWMYFRQFELIETARSRTARRDQASAEAVAHTVRQAREYFASAAGASLLTRPVLLYYGMVSLAKLLLLLDRVEPLTIDQIEVIERQGHGLKETDSTEAPDRVWRLEDCAVEIVADRKRSGLQGRGIFPQLAHRLVSSGSERWLGEQVAFLELLQAVPQLDLLLRQTFGEENGFAGVGVRRERRGDDFDLELMLTPGVATLGDVLDRLPYLDASKHEVLAVTESGHQFKIRVSESEFYSLPSREEFSEHINVLPAAVFGVRMEGFLAQYALLYALSIIARYKPHRWGSILRGESTPILPIVEHLIAIAYRWFPNVVLNKLTDSVILFAPHSYWS